jgi:hypothetical protein
MRLQYSGDEWTLIAMKQIADRHGVPAVFSLDPPGDSLWLNGFNALPAIRWSSVNEFVFRSRKLET